MIKMPWVKEDSILTQLPVVANLNNPLALPTSHVEKVALLTTQQVNRSLEIEIETDELDLTRSEAKPTCEDIQKYCMHVFEWWGGEYHPLEELIAEMDEVKKKQKTGVTD